MIRLTDEEKENINELKRIKKKRIMWSQHRVQPLLRLGMISTWV